MKSTRKAVQIQVKLPLVPVNGAADSKNQVEKLNDSELYEIPNSLEFGATSNGRDEEQSYIYY